MRADPSGGAAKPSAGAAARRGRDVRAFFAIAYHLLRSLIVPKAKPISSTLELASVLRTAR